MKPIIIALDNLSKQEAFLLAAETAGSVWGFKVHELLLREGAEVITELKKHGKVFADLKFHDTPSTVKSEVAALLSRGADLVSVHASGGLAMLEAAFHSGGNAVVAITALSSLSAVDTELIYRQKPEKAVNTLAGIAVSAGIRNIVCSPHEVKVVKSIDPSVTVITPGIRLSVPFGQPPEVDQIDDQSRVTTPKKAIDAGADLLVIGRPITKAPNPRSALSAIISQIS